jgi:hypothetical protein
MLSDTSTLAPQGHAIVFFHTRWDRRWDAGTRFLYWAVGLCLLVTLILQEGLLPQAAPSTRATLAALVALPAAAVIAARHYTGRYHTVRITADVVRLFRGRHEDRVDPAAVRGLVALPGISLDGGEMVVWKALLVLTDYRQYRLHFDAAPNAECYRALRAVCPHAWGAPFAGELERPTGSTRAEALPAQLAALTRLVGAIRRDILRAFLAGAGLVFGSLAAAAGVLLNSEFDGDVAKGLVLLIMFIAVGTFLMGHALGRIGVVRRMGRARRALAAEVDGGQAGR